MAGIGMIVEQIALVKGIAERTLQKHYHEELKIGRAAGVATLMRTAHQQALSGNTTMLIFLLKTRCGLIEKRMMVDENGNPVSPVNVNVGTPQSAVLRVPGMMDPKEWNTVALEHQRKLLGGGGTR